MIYAKKGEVITCKNDHPIANILHDIFVGGSHQFNDDGKSLDMDYCYDTPQPKIGSSSKNNPCRICGEPFFFSSNYHFIDGWRGNITSYPSQDLYSGDKSFEEYHN